MSSKYINICRAALAHPLKAVKRVLCNVLIKDIQPKSYDVKMNIVCREEYFKDKVVFVTGGSGYIGGEICRRFAADGAFVIISGRNEGKLRELSNSLNSNGFKTDICVMDLCDEENIKTSIGKVFDKYGRIDILVNCAGHSSREKCKSFYMQEPSIIREVVNSNLVGLMMCTRYVSAKMVEQGNGNIINISSTVGIGGKPFMTEYAAAKAGVIAVTKNLAIELGRFGIRVNCVSPGLIHRGAVSPSVENIYLEKAWFNRIGYGEDVTGAVMFLASDEAGYITGQNIIIDGGRSLGLKGDGVNG